MREAANVPGLAGLALGPELSARLGLPVWLENDVRVATLGETWHGAGRGAETLVVVFAGTGVGSGIMLKGKLWRGVSGSAGGGWTSHLNRPRPYFQLGSARVARSFKFRPGFGHGLRLTPRREAVKRAGGLFAIGPGGGGRCGAG